LPTVWTAVAARGFGSVNVLLDLVDAVALKEGHKPDRWLSNCQPDEPTETDTEKLLLVLIPPVEDRHVTCRAALDKRAVIDLHYNR